MVIGTLISLIITMLSDSRIEIIFQALKQTIISRLIIARYSALHPISFNVVIRNFEMDPRHIVAERCHIMHRELT